MGDILDSIGIILALVLGLVLAIFLGWLTGSFIVGIITFIFGSGFLYSKWLEGLMPYNVNEIKNNTKK